MAEQPNVKPSDDLLSRADNKLLAHYTRLRRQEHELLTKLIDTLEQVDNLPEDQMEQMRDALFHTDYPFMMMLVGPFSSGKSSFINAILGETILEVGAVPTTDHIHILRHGPQVQKAKTGDATVVFHPNPLLESLSFVDTPGLESVFEKHDTITRKFLHRADLVLLVMVATRVLSASNLDFLQELKGYGKRSIIVVNQIDLLEEEDRQTVRNFVEEQSRLHLGFEPIIWMVSSKQAMEAQRETPRDEILYDQSGFAEIEEYLAETLGDRERIKQKLETPLLIATNVLEKASTQVQENQVTLTEHRNTLKNIEMQIEEAATHQRQTVETSTADIDRQWSEATMRGSEAIGELFQFSRAFGQIISGLLELVGIASLLRRIGGRTRAEAAFEKHNVTEALTKIPEMVDMLGARLEGRDVQDLDDLVQYTNKKIGELPPNLKDKVIGRVQGPMNYDRSFLRRVRTELDNILNEARRFETKRLDRQLTNMLIIAAVWEIIVIALALAFGIPAAQSANSGTLFAIFAVILLAAIGGLALLPLRGWLLERAYSKRMFDLKEQYHKILNDALKEQLAYGIQIRKDTTAPFTRLIESQAKLTDELKKQIDTSERAIEDVQKGLAIL
ncbi:MAG: dynamin family protein [Anaerolineae bacterium]|nr:dynamin family protein [Anaerolineae bacterium]